MDLNPTPEEFGEGLETPVVTTPVVPAAPAVDPVIEWARNSFEGIDENTTPDAFAAQIAELQAQASKAAEYEQQLQELQARLIQQATAPAPTPAAPVAQTPVTPAPAPRVRRFEPLKVDQSLQMFLTDEYVAKDANGMLRPKMMVPQVIAACDLQNRATQREREIAAGLTGDFYGAVNEALEDSAYVKSLKDEITSLKNLFNEQVVPLQKSAEQLEAERFMWQNQGTLFAQDATDNSMKPTPAGELYNTLVGEGMAREKALEIAKAMAARIPAPTPAPAPAAPAVKKPAKPFVSPIIQRRMEGGANGIPRTEHAEAEPSEVITPDFRPTWGSIRRAVDAAATN